MENIQEKIIAALSAIPYKGSNIHDAELISVFKLENTHAELDVTFPDDTDDDAVHEAITQALLAVDGIESVKINPTNRLKGSEPDTSRSQPQPAAGKPERKSHLSNYRYVVAVASGKGGVGKSTVTLNLACALKSLGKTVSVFDADIYGPSVPLMMGEPSAKAKVVAQQILPISKYGIEFMSIANLIDDDASVIWRGPMVHQAVDQILRDTKWPGGDYILLDLPPGTGDVQITLSQVTALSGAVIVCTPQDVALLDAVKAMTMFEKVNVPILGMIENMSSFVCPKCAAESPIFGINGCRKTSELKDHNFLGSIPIDLETRVCGDNGKPVSIYNTASPVTARFVEIAKNLDYVLSDED